MARRIVENLLLFVFRNQLHHLKDKGKPDFYFYSKFSSNYLLNNDNKCLTSTFTEKSDSDLFNWDFWKLFRTIDIPRIICLWMYMYEQIYTTVQNYSLILSVHCTTILWVMSSYLKFFIKTWKFNSLKGFSHKIFLICCTKLRN